MSRHHNKLYGITILRSFVGDLLVVEFVRHHALLIRPTAGEICRRPVFIKRQRLHVSAIKSPLVTGGQRFVTYFYWRRQHRRIIRIPAILQRCHNRRGRGLICCFNRPAHRLLCRTSGKPGNHHHNQRQFETKLLQNPTQFNLHDPSIIYSPS